MRERLYRSQKDKMVAGVCGGLAEYFDVDPVIIRIAFIGAMFLTGGMGLIVYILLWIVVPYREQVATAATASGSASYTAPAGSETASEGTAAAETPSSACRERRSRPILGYILVALGLLFFADRFFPYVDFHDFWPLVLVALGIGLLLRSSKK